MMHFDLIFSSDRCTICDILSLPRWAETRIGMRASIMEHDQESDAADAQDDGLALQGLRMKSFVGA